MDFYRLPTHHDTAPCRPSLPRLSTLCIFCIWELSSDVVVFTGHTSIGWLCNFCYIARFTGEREEGWICWFWWTRVRCTQNVKFTVNSKYICEKGEGGRCICTHFHLFSRISHSFAVWMNFLFIYVDCRPFHVNQFPGDIFMNSSVVCLTQPSRVFEFVRWNCVRSPWGYGNVFCLWFWSILSFSPQLAPLSLLRRSVLMLFFSVLIAAVEVEQLVGDVVERVQRERFGVYLQLNLKGCQRYGEERVCAVFEEAPWATTEAAAAEQWRIHVKIKTTRENEDEKKAKKKVGCWTRHKEIMKIDWCSRYQRFKGIPNRPRTTREWMRENVERKMNEQWSGKYIGFDDDGERREDDDARQWLE